MALNLFNADSHYCRFIYKKNEIEDKHLLIMHGSSQEGIQRVHKFKRSNLSVEFNGSLKEVYEFFLDQCNRDKWSNIDCAWYETEELPQEIIQRIAPSPLS